MQVKCGWAKQWDPPNVPGCVDPRGCAPPPPRNDEIWGSYEESATKNLDVGSTYWYSCRSGLFVFGNGSATSFIDLKCINADDGGSPYWSPPYDNDINPFPMCQIQCKYTIQILFEIIMFVDIEKASWKYYCVILIFLLASQEQTYANTS